MLKKENWMDSFRTQSRENVYVLKVSIIKEKREEKNIREVVDCPKGEVGAWYANNLLCRLANEALMGTELEKISWRERRYVDVSAESDEDFACLRMESRRNSDKDYAYMKSKDQRNYAIAEMKWYQQLPEE